MAARAADFPAHRNRIRQAQAAARSAVAAHGGTVLESLDTAVVLTPDGYLNPRVWPDEPAWHKALDLVGDLALVGARIAGGVLAVRGGHRAHVALAARLRREMGCTIQE